MAAHVLGIGPLVGWNPEEDEHKYIQQQTRRMQEEPVKFQKIQIFLQ